MIVKESISFQRNLKPSKALRIGQERLKDDAYALAHIENAVKDLRDNHGLHVNMSQNTYQEGIIDIEIDELMYEDNRDNYYMVAFLLYSARKWFSEESESWGWGIFDNDEGDVIFKGESDWEATKKKILELL